MSIFSDINARQLPKMLKYSELTPLGVASSAKKINFFPAGSSIFSPANNIIRIPISSGSCFLDGSMTCLKFTYVNEDINVGNFSCIDGSGSSFIARMRISSASSNADLEDIRFYGQLHAALSDMAMSLPQRFSRLHEGYGSGGLLKPFASGFSDGVGVGEPSIAAGHQSYTFSIPILSSIIGVNSKKYFPLFLSGQITLEIELAPYPTFVSGTEAVIANAEHNIASVVAVPVVDAPPNFTIKDVELHTQLIEFNSDINNSLKELCFKPNEELGPNGLPLPNGLFLHVHQWSSYQQSNLASGAYSMVISERLKSVKSVLVNFSQARTNQTRNYARYHGDVNSLQFKIGSGYYPDQPISGMASNKTTNSEYLVELFKAMGHYSDSQHASLINSENFTSNLNTKTFVGRALYGIDLDGFSAVNGEIESGLNMILNNPMTITTSNIASAVPGAAPLVANTMHAHLLHDVLIRISNDGKVSKSS